VTPRDVLGAGLGHGLRTSTEAAEFLRCSRKTLSAHAGSGALRYVIVGHGTKRPRRMFTMPICQSSSSARRAGTRHVGLQTPGLAVLPLRLPMAR
jgi:hypothetical protein